MRFAILTLTLMLAGFAQEQPQPRRDGPEAAIIPVKTLSGDSFQRLAQLLRVFKIEYAADEKLRTILVYGSPEKVAEVRRVVAELDRPGSEAAIGRNIEMSVTLLKCSTAGNAATATALPPDIESVGKQLRAASLCRQVEVWDTIPLRLQEGKHTEQSSRLSWPLPDAPDQFATAQISMQPEAVTLRDSVRSVRFNWIKIGFRIPYLAGKAGPAPQIQFIELGLNTSGDFREGQKSVLGKVSGLDQQTSIFAVLSLKVLD